MQVAPDVLKRVAKRLYQLMPGTGRARAREGAGWLEGFREGAEWLEGVLGYEYRYAFSLRVGQSIWTDRDWRKILEMERHGGLGCVLVWVEGVDKEILYKMKQKVRVQNDCTT